MATVTLTSEQCREDGLPNVCAKCGAPAADRVERSFSWFPPWTGALIPFGILPGVLLMYYLTRTMTVRVPFCAAHARHWATPALVARLGLPLCVALLVLSVALRGAAVEVSVLVFLAFAIVVGLWQGRLIRPERISRDEIVLSGVSAAFAAAAKRRDPARRAYGDFDDADGPWRNRYDVDVEE